uniref:Uncharacterized protein n=1 Tax=Anopheles farauti TaxID=69004 RepID=A0A182PZP7_9DIPT
MWSSLLFALPLKTMKKSTEMELKNLASSKLREKSMRSRNKRKCKRKKNARTIKRYCGIKDAPHHDTQEYCGERKHQTRPYRAVHLAGADLRTELRLKHAQNVWIRTYQRIVKWHGKHQTNYWKQCAQQLKVENDRLKRQMYIRPVTRNVDPTEVPGGGSDSDEDYYDEDDPFDDTEDESEDKRDANEGSDHRLQRRTSRSAPGEEPELDEQFLAFMEVSARHRLEHRRLKNESVH